MKKHLKTILAPIIIVLTIVAFAYYANKHPQTIDKLKDMPPLTLVAIVALYFVWFIALALITRASLYMYNKRMGIQENFLFNAYSSLINFFGPGQSGPIFRGAYLKKRHNLGIKPYLFTLLIYYAFYAVISAFLMFIGTRPWWQTILVVLAAGLACYSVLKKFTKKNKAKLDEQALINPRTLLFLFAMTVFQIAAQTVIFGIELHNAGAGASLGQVLAYTGVANFALFVALTPGAIGIREAFLGFSQDLHHVGGSTIAAANVVDRASYLVFLGILFIIVISLHAKDKLHIKQLDLDKPPKA